MGASETIEAQAGTGRLSMWTYIRDTNGSLLLFYDPQERIALTIIDWS